MADPSSTPGKDTGKKATTQVIAIPPPGIKARPPAENKSQTMRISLADIMPATHAQADSKQTTMPITEFMPATTPVPPSTIQLKRPPSFHGAAPEGPTTAKAKTGPLDRPEAGSKKGTTRLILDAASETVSPTELKRSTSPITVIPQTIRLKRAGAPAEPPPAKARTDPLAAEAPTVGRMPDMSQAKMVTARIMVEETTPALDAPTEPKRATAPLGVAAPRTIRLKKPSAAGLEEAAAAGPELETPTVRKSLKKETSKITLPAATEPAPITQRKTIKIKRTEHNIEPRTVKMKMPGAAAAPTPGVPQAGAVSEDEAPSVLFFSLAVAAVVLIAGLVYLMAAQAFGPELLLPVPSSLL